MWGSRGSDPVVILILESLNPWNPRNPRNPWNPWKCRFSRVAGSYEDIDEWGHVGEASLWPCHDGAPPSYPPPCLSFAYKTIVWLPYHAIPWLAYLPHTKPYYTMQCLPFAYKIILYHSMTIFAYHAIPSFCIQNHTIPYNACLSHTIPYHAMTFLSFTYKTIPLPCQTMECMSLLIEEHSMSHHAIPCHTKHRHAIPHTMKCLSFVYHLSCSVSSSSCNVLDKN